MADGLRTQSRPAPSLLASGGSAAATAGAAACLLACGAAGTLLDSAEPL
eukprot:CAMPEP_0119416182 /NCGR_PEP_ID=MMETSP1335-20130426/11970_1 /TAXON_ID=259385 /ORGANISM="Chrysoculter rhomboideus, Strain RCC1486" /LENGTH=48 /DNA_ID= /DNA_START= /DNA_END= /DNA_ORIENTATION=